MFWPISHNFFGALNYAVTSLPVQITEIILFAVTLPIMYKLKDLQSLFKTHNLNWALIIPLGAVVGPLLQLGGGEENGLPILLVIPSLFYVGLFAYSLFIWFRSKTNLKVNSQNRRNNYEANRPNYTKPNG